jgi:hypothetical protein
MPPTSYGVLIVMGRPCRGPVSVPEAVAWSVRTASSSGPLRVEGDDCVERHVPPFDPLEQQLEQFPARQLPLRINDASSVAD